MSTTPSEHEFEAAPGLPEPLPQGERLLWQGSPDWRALARRAFHVRKLAAYFALMLALRGAAKLADGGTAGDALLAVLWLAPVALLGLGLVVLLAWLSARSAVYTITDRRVVMRIGIVLTVTFNLPFRAIESADLRADTDGFGDIPLTLKGPDRIAYLHLWPHARPRRLGRPQPMLRSIPRAAEVARVLSSAWAQRNGIVGQPAIAPRPQRVDERRPAVLAH
jgi:hypothetical protein